MTYQKNIKITVSKAEQKVIDELLTTIEEMDAGCEMDARDILYVLAAIREKSEEVEISAFDSIEIEYKECLSEKAKRVQS